MDQRLFVTLHNIVNIPNEIKTAAGTTMMYSVEIHCDTQGCATAAGGFLKNEINEAHGHLEVFWEDGANTTQTATATHIPAPESVKEWIVGAHVRTLDAMASVFETNQASGRRRQLGTSVPFTVDTRQVLSRKITTRILGTSTGQIGVSFCVSPHDHAGYKARLEEFLKANNPAGLSLVPSVVSSVSEIETFNKVFKKYNKEDYPHRVRTFFEMYGPEHIAAIPSTLKEWDNREEELLRHLVLENGPEPNDIDLRLRLLAFVEKYNITDLDVESLVEAHRNDPTVLFTALVSRHGPEPDPRTYLYPAVFFAEPGAEAAAAIAAPAAPAPQPQQHVDTQQHQPQQVQPLATHGSSAPIAATSQPEASGARPAELTQRTPQTVEPAPQAVQAAPVHRTPAPQMTPSASGAAQLVSDTELWSGFCNSLRRSSIPPAELYYLNEASFATLLAELGYDQGQHAALHAEWQRRVKSALQQTYLGNHDAQHDAAKRDVIALSGLQPLNVQVMGVMALKNSEHESSFSLRLAAAKVRATERMLFVGEFNELVSFATTGFAPSPNQGNAILLRKKPFAHIKKPSTVALLVCDVIVGKPLVSVMDAPTPPTPDFFQSYDSCVTRVNTDEQGVLVYQPQQVIPRFLVHCSVDTTIVACPAHPARQVEYYIPDENVFACSQCVVLGQYRNREVLSIDDAALQARSHLADMAREVKVLREDLTTQERDLERSLLQLENSEQWQAAKRQADAIRRDAEIRAAEILREAERQQEEQQSALAQSKSQVSDVLQDVQRVTDMVNGGVDVGSTEAIQVLCQLKDTRALETIRDRVGTSRQATARSASGGTMFAAPRQPHIGGGEISRTASLHSIPTSEPALPAAPAADDANSNKTGGGSNDLFSKFQALKGSTPGPYQHNTPTPRDPGTLFGGQQRMAPAFASSSLQRVRGNEFVNNTTAQEHEVKHSKEQMTKGWAAYRAGNKALAQQLWTEVFERNANNAVGARARAYLAEAVERDYQTASVWYEKALQIDSQDTMTLFNYAVLLESVLGKKREALELFEAAYRLGDHTAGRRAQLLRQQLSHNQ